MVDPPSTPPLNALAARERATQAPNANDFRQFAALRRGADANDPDTLREVARQFESIFTKMMLESMRSASFGDPMFGSDQVDMYQGMMDDQLAVQLSQGRGLGLADMLIRQLGQGGRARPPRARRRCWTTIGGVTPEQQREIRRRDAAACRPPRRANSAWMRAPSSRRRRSKPAGARRSPRMRAATVTISSASRPAPAGSGASVASDTTEFVAGEAGTERARFRAYGSLAENVADYVRVLRDNPRYSAALGTGADVRAFANALQRGGYATDPEYADKLVAIAEKLGAAGNPLPRRRLQM